MTIIKYWNTFVQNLADFVFLAFKKDQDTVVIQHFNPTSKKHSTAYRNRGWKSMISGVVPPAHGVHVQVAGTSLRK